MTLRNLTAAKAVISTAVQLCLQGHPEEEVFWGLDEDQIAAIRALVVIHAKAEAEEDTAVPPPALLLDTDGWQQRRKDLGITK